ncbi:MAG: XRE family transcriptional regulator [Actinomycetota bacterium]|nr:XRE family transcriptional regulator [Actinomycetota bacterium]
MDRRSSGVGDLDVLLGGLIAGDNMVWVSSDAELLEHIEKAFVEEGGRRGEPCLYVSASAPKAKVVARLGPNCTVLDARPRSRLADPVALEQTLVKAATAAPGRMVLDGLDDFARRWGHKKALGFFSRVCPRLFDLGSTAYWRASRSGLGSRFLDGVRNVTQCVIEINRDQLRVVKAEGRGAALQGRLVRLRMTDGDIRLGNERALGRLGEGLRRLRGERHLSQGDLARLAGVSPSAISQAEAGHRGLSLDTLLTLSEGLGVGLDELLVNEASSDYVLARRDRVGPGVANAPLLDDPTTGLRAYLVSLRPGDAGSPPIAHKGVEMVLVGQGLVQIDLGAATPVLRAGDAALVTKVPVVGWRNLSGEPARLFWILRD